AEIAEDRGDRVDDLADRMNSAALGGRLAHRQGDIDGLGDKARLDRGVAQRALAGRHGVGDALLQPVDRWPHDLTFFGAHRAEHLQPLGHRSLLAKYRITYGFDRSFVRSDGDGVGDGTLELFKFTHVGVQISSGLLFSTMVVVAERSAWTE